jgi:hypothetical protein
VPDTISIIEDNADHFMVVTSNESIGKLFKKLYGEEAIWFIKKPKLSKKHPFKSLLNVRRAKKEVQDQIDSYKDNNIYAFFISYCFYEAWMVKRLSKRNTIFYKPAVEVPVHESYDWLGFLKKYLIKLGYGVDTNFNFFSGVYRPIIGEEYLDSVDAKTANPKTNIHYIEDTVSRKFQVKAADILLLVGSIVEMGFVSESDYCKEMDRLLKMLKRHGFTVSLKVHPRFNQLFSLEKKLPQIPSYLPANLILNNFNLVVGYSTSTLFEAANNGKKSISLLKYFTPCNKQKVEDVHSYLKSNLEVHSRIIFPQDLTQLLQNLLK